VSYAIDTSIGQLTPSLALANIYKWQSALTPSSPLVDYVNSGGGYPGWSPRWKGTAALRWKKGSLSTNLSGRYIGRYLTIKGSYRTQRLGIPGLRRQRPL